MFSRVIMFSLETMSSLATMSSLVTKFIDIISSGEKRSIYDHVREEEEGRHSGALTRQK